MLINKLADNEFWQRNYIEPGLTDLVTYALTVASPGTSSVAGVVNIQALDVNGKPLLQQSNLLVRLTTGVLPVVDSTNGTLTALTGTTLVEDLHTNNSAINASKEVKLQSSVNGVWHFSVTNGTGSEAMGLVIGPCEGSLRGDFTTAGLSYGQVNYIAVLPAGTGYTYGATAAITGGGGSGATATVTVVAGAVTAIVVTNQGSGYTTAPTVTISPGSSPVGLTPGSGATATAHVTFAH